MLGWVITCHDELAQEMLDRLEQKFGPLAQCRAVNYWRNLSSRRTPRSGCAMMPGEIKQRDRYRFCYNNRR